RQVAPWPVELLETRVMLAAAPIIDLDGNDSSGAHHADFRAVFEAGGAPVHIADTDATISDADSANLSQLTATIKHVKDPGDEILAATTTGTNITSSYDATTGVLTLSGNDTVANYQTVLRSVTYVDTADNPHPGHRKISVIATDSAALPSNVA